MAYLDLIDLQVGYEMDNPILDQFDLAVEEGELVSLLGPSGCGKTTTLRTVAGFIEPTAGRVIIDGQDNTRLAPNKRDIGLVFQSYALFPHLTVDDNVGFGLRMRGVGGAEKTQRVQEALEVVDLAGYGDRRPSQLSGGQRQRVAVARAIVIEPKLLLMDEPLSNLDAKLRVGMRTELRRLQRQLGTTMVYVTHDQVEALSLSDRIVVMNQGEIEQIGVPDELFALPATPFVADFMGFENHFDAVVSGVQEAAIQLRTGEVQLSAARSQQAEALEEGAPVQVYFRPESARLATETGTNSVPGEVILRTFRGSSIEYVIRTDLGEFTVHDDDDLRRVEGDRVHVVLEPRKLVVLAK